MRILEITYDPEARAGYLYFSRKPVAKTVHRTGAVNLDLDKQGRLIGIELLGISIPWNSSVRLMGQYLVKIRKLSETEEILHNPDLVAQIRRAEAYFNRGGKGYTIDEIFGPEPKKALLRKRKK